MPKTYEELLGFKKMQKVAKERLHKPPMAPKVINRVELSVREDHYKEIASETPDSVAPLGEEGNKLTVQSTDSKLAIDFNNLDPKYQKWALSLETQRHYYYTKFGKVHRKDRIEVKKDLEEKEIELDAIEVMKKQKTPAFIGVINEFKAKVKKLRGRKDE